MTWISRRFLFWRIISTALPVRLSPCHMTVTSSTVLLQKIFVLEQDGSIKPYIGGYSDYVEALQEESSQQAQPAKAKPVAAAKPAEEPAKKKMTYGERLELERLDQEIARSEAELKMLGAEINQCGSDFTRLADLTKQQEAVQQKLDEMVDRWAYLSELAEAEG